MSLTGDDPYGLWSVSADASEDTFSCQQNIVLRNNIARWPRAGARGRGSMRARNKSARDFADCDCSSVPMSQTCGHPYGSHGSCCQHSCYAAYAGGSGVQILNNSCEGSFLFLQLSGDYPVTKRTKWCGAVAVAGNTVSAMPGQGSGCMLDNRYIHIRIHIYGSPL